MSLKPSIVPLKQYLVFSTAKLYEYVEAFDLKESRQQINWRLSSMVTRHRVSRQKACSDYSDEEWIELDIKVIRNLCLICGETICPTKQQL